MKLLKGRLKDLGKRQQWCHTGYGLSYGPFTHGYGCGDGYGSGYERGCGGFGHIGKLSVRFEKFGLHGVWFV